MFRMCLSVVRCAKGVAIILDVFSGLGGLGPLDGPDFVFRSSLH